MSSGSPRRLADFDWVRRFARVSSLALIVACSALAVRESPAHPPAAPSSASTSAAAQAMTQTLLDLDSRFRGARTASQRASLEAALLAAAEARLALLAALAQDDPGAALAASLPATARSRLPASLAPYLEQDADVLGTLEVLHEDRTDGSRYHYVLHSARGRFALGFAGHPPEHMYTGATVRARGIEIGDVLALADGRTDVQQVAAAPLPKTLGALRTLLILVNFSDNATQPYTMDDARAALFGTTSAFFAENSYQQSWLAGDALGWFTLPVPSAGCDYTSIASYAKSAATAAGANLAAYDHLVYAFPQNGCSWWGLSSVGGAPSQSWINGSFELAVLGHELGHGLGLFHAHALDCGTATIGTTMSSTYPPAPGTCYSIDYGDVVDMMGSAFPGHYTAFEKERLGWLNAGLSPPITTITTSGTYSVEAAAIQSANAKALKIMKSTDPVTGAKTWYYVEARRSLGFDSVIDTTASMVGITSTIPNGVLVHVGTDGSGNSGALLDMSPATDTSIWDWLVNAPLLAGQSFTDSVAGVTITTASSTSTGAAVTVQFAVPPPAAGSTTVTIATDKPSYSPGQTSTITATVTSGGAAVSGAAVTFQVVKPNGSIVTAKVTSGSSGKAVYKLRLRKQDPVGTYRAEADAVKGNQMAEAVTTFAVK